MTRADSDHFERERLEADKRYNAALTTLDSAIALATSQTVAAPDEINRAANALIVYVQQITAFVETKDREIAASTALRFDELTPSLDAITEMRTQIGVLQRAIEMLTHSTWLPQPTDNATSPAPRQADDYKYVGFEDAFRGSDQTIEERLRAYVPLFAECADVLDIGCGRGEMLAALRDAGVTARGIDTNSAMVAAAHERGLEAQQADALAYLSAQPEASLGGLIAAQVIEHLEPSYLMRMIDAAARALRPGAPIVLETINPACWLAFFSSYLRDFTHVRPVHPDTLQYLLRASGFARVDIHYSAPVPAHMKMQTIDLAAGLLASPDPVPRALAQIAHAVNANAVVLNNLLFTHLDYAAIGYRS